MDYPYNPNGSDEGIAAVCSDDGRHMCMMPHPCASVERVTCRERTLTRWAWPYWPEEWDFSESPWLKMFQNARIWCEEINERQH